MLADQLRARARRRGADPVVTYYDLTSGERTELSGVSFLNWVDKTSNLLVDELLLDAGSVVDLRLARTAPGHWMTFVLEMAAWQVGAVVRVSDSPEPAELLVLGPDWDDQDRSAADHDRSAADHDRSAAGAVLACSLHPLGLGFATALPADVTDFSLEVRGQSDHHTPSPRRPAEPAWQDDDRRLAQQDLVEVEHDERPSRRLVLAAEPWPSVRDGLVVPVLTGGSAVVVVGSDPDRLSRIVDTERVDRT